MDRIITSIDTRAAAEVISQETAAPIAEVTDALRPWEVDAERAAVLISKRPNEGPESFNAFKRRALGYIGKLMEHHEQNPSDRTVAVTPDRSMRLLEAWARKGFPKDLAIDSRHMLTDSRMATAQYLRKTAGGKWKLSALDIKHDAAMPKSGIFPICA